MTVVPFRVLQLEVELSRQRHDGDLKEKNRLACMLDNKVRGNLVFSFVLEETLLARDLFLVARFSLSEMAC